MSEDERTAEACRRLRDLARELAGELGPANEHAAVFERWADRLSAQAARLAARPA